MIDFKYPKGTTPIDPDEAEGLLLTHITTQGELNRWEQENVLHCSPFTWGGRDLSNPSGTRSRYINALQNADNGDYIALLEFAKS